MPHLQFAEQADGDHLDARQNQDSSYDEERPVLIHHMLMCKELERGQEDGDSSTEKHSQCAEQPEEVQRPHHVLQQKTNGQQIEEDAEGAADSVVRFAALAIYVLDGNFTDARAVPGRKRRNKAVHLAVQGNVVDHFAAVGLEGRAEVVNVHARKLRHQPVRACGKECGA